MSSALLSTTSIPEISRALSHGQDLKRSLRNSYPHPVYVQPPDKGWGWMVVFAAFLCSAIVDGLIFSFPCVFGLLVDDINTGYWVAILCAAIQIFCYLIIGPIISSFLTQNSCRQFVCCGSVVATCGFLFSALLSSELTNEYYCLVIITLGAAVGSGLGCIYISSVLAVNCFFVRHRIAATTIALSGSGVGMTVLPPLIAYFTQNLHFYEAMFCFAAVSMQTLFLGLLIWPLSELPPGCDLQAGVLPREKDIFDYIRERVGYPKSGGSRDSDISLHARQDAVKVARARRILKLRNESECEPQWASRMDSERSGESPQPTSSTMLQVAMSPIRDFLSRQRLRKSASKTGPNSGTASDAPSPSPSSQSGPGTPVIYSHKTAPVLSIAADVVVGASSRRQSTIPDQIFSIASQQRQISQAPSDLPSIAAGISMVENISVITDLGRRLDECSDVSEFFLVLDPQNTPSKASVKANHTPRNKSVSECIHPNGTSGGLISGESFTPTDILPPTLSSGGESTREIETGISNPSTANEPVDFVVGSVPDDDYMAAILAAQDKYEAIRRLSETAGKKDEAEAEANCLERSETECDIESQKLPSQNGLAQRGSDNDAGEQSNMTRIDSDIAELPQSLEHASHSIGKRLYRRQSSSRSSRLAVLRQKSLQKGEQRAAESAASNGPATPDAILQMLLNEQAGGSSSINGSDDMSVDESAMNKTNGNSNGNNRYPNGGALGATSPSPTSPNATRTSEVATPPPPSPHCPWFFRMCDVRLFMYGINFPVLCLANAFAMAGIFVPLLFCPLRMIWMYGLNQNMFQEDSPTYQMLSAIQNGRMKAGFIIAVAGAIGCVARLGVVIGTEIRRSNPIITTCVAFLVHTIVAASIPLISDFASLSILIAIYSVCTELFVSMTTSIIRWSFQPDGSLNGQCDAIIVNSAYLFLTNIRAFSAASGLIIAGILFSIADPFGSCLLVLPLSPLREYGISLPTQPEPCDDAFSYVMYYSAGAFFASFLLHSALLLRYTLQKIQRKKKRSINASTASNGSFL